MKWLVAISLMFLAMPLGAQDRQITIPRDVNEINIVIDSITVGIILELPEPDTAAIRREEAGTRATENLAAAIAADGGNTIVTWQNGGITAAILLGVYYLRKISQNSGHSHESPGHSHGNKWE